MSNELTPFIPSLFAEGDVVSRELTGFIPSVARNSSAARAALDEVIYVPVSNASTVFDVSPSMSVPEPNNFTVDNVGIKITKSRAVSFGLTGEETRGLSNGLGVKSILNGQFSQALRALVNEIEHDIAAEGAKNACRAYGTAGTTPFATNLKDVAQVRKMLDDNGAPQTGRSLILDTTAGAQLRTLTQLTNVNEAGTEMTLHTGELMPLLGFSVKESAQIVMPDVGTAAKTADVNTDAYDKGATKIKLKTDSAATGTILVGDYISFAGDSNKYLVTKGAAAVSGAEIEIAKPGLLVPIAANAAPAVEVIAKSSRLLGFTQNAIQLVTRAPAMPDGGDAASDSMMFTDPYSRLSFEIRYYKGYHKSEAQVACAWGVKAIKPEHIVSLLG